MAHELDFSTGEAGIALRGGKDTAWHGLGQTIEPGDSIQTIQRKAGLLWTAETAPITYTDKDGNEHGFDNRQIIYRSDTSAALGLTSENRYKIVQPRDSLEFFSDFLTENKLSIETAGSLRGGRLIWCMAKLGKDYEFLMPGKDKIDGYVRLQTSFDGSRATDLVATSVRQVCANTMRLVDIDADRAGFKTAHSSTFDAKGLQRAFGLLGEQHKVTAEVWNNLAKRKVSQAEAAKYFADLLGVELKDIGKTGDDGKKLVSTRTENTLNELAAAFAQSPGATLKSAHGTAFGLLQAVTYYADHQAKAQDTFEDGKSAARMHSAWFGSGEKMKDDAQWFAAELAGCQELIDKAYA